MAKFSKYNQPKRRKTTVKRSSHSQSYIEERKAEMYQLTANCKTDAERQLIIDAFNLSI